MAIFLQVRLAENPYVGWWVYLPAYFSRLSLFPSFNCTYDVLDLLNEPVDTDGEELTDERTALDTDPTEPDTDGDGSTDKEDVDVGADPLNPNSSPGNGKPVIDVTNIKGLLWVGQTIDGE
ncbi:hypothetical protein CD175_27420 [Pseudomonas laurylsulfatiphila]|uniref:Uncharacterized protein n=1 Tax=Pseudomonas laurylsulfatiphila TaxID=2011015 RepID=A0A2S6FET9_9PSED|nr:thrombospondin type 3 repeat-containing protein [Pseudomonas laurylsulfatiphila]PPK35921.1 hypothetical protein CD175_27420 [Pseudomonas laurylsulfatiphila]